MSATGYRPEVDGLRAVAVLAVLFYHVEFDFLPGGFVGVDIFFVISGYLISKLVINQVTSGSFSFGMFYLRRIRRLLPALLGVLILTFTIEYLYYPASEFEKFSGSLIYSLAGISNIFFWLEVGYFDTAANLKPLLHTWSLSVEEQFYLFFPLLILICIKSKIKYILPVSLLVLALVSYFLNVAVFSEGFYKFIGPNVLYNSESSAFYLMPFRCFEFLIGTSIVWLERARISSQTKNNAIFLVGVLSIAYSLVFLTKAETFPYYNALPSCIGAALIIYSSSQGLPKNILSSKILVFVGLVSYSLYLFHWPVIIYWKEFLTIKYTLIDKISIVVLSLLIATVSYYVIEKPFRKTSKTDPTFLIGIFSTSIILFILSTNVWKYDGWAWRGDEIISKLEVSEIQENEIYTNEINLNYPTHENLENAITCSFDVYRRERSKEKFDDVGRCIKYKINDGGYLVMGDSTGRDSLSALKKAYPKENFAMLHQSSCPPAEDFKTGCFIGLPKFFDEYLNGLNIKGIILASRFIRPNYKVVVRDVNSGMYDGHDLFIIGPFIAKKGSIGKIVRREGYNIVGEYTFYKKMEKIVNDIENDLIKVAANKGVKYFSKNDAFCSNEKCKLHNNNNQVLLIDDTHLSRLGMEFMSKKLLESSFLYN